MYNAVSYLPALDIFPSYVSPPVSSPEVSAHTTGRLSVSFQLQMLALTCLLCSDLTVNIEVVSTGHC